jgi:hypothetical protein
MLYDHEGEEPVQCLLLGSVLVTYERQEDAIKAVELLLRCSVMIEDGTRHRLHAIRENEAFLMSTFL